MTNPFAETKDKETQDYDKGITRKFYAEHNAKQIALFADEATRDYLVGLSMKQNGAMFVRFVREVLEAGGTSEALDKMGERRLPAGMPDYVTDLVPLQKRITALRSSDRGDYIHRFNNIAAALRLVGLAHSRATAIYNNATRKKDDFATPVLAEMWEEHTVMRAVKFAYGTWATGEFLVLVQDLNGFEVASLKDDEFTLPIFQGLM